MYLKKVTNQRKIEQLSSIMPFCFGTWYRKMNENGRQAQNEQGFNLYTCMVDIELKTALENKEFTRVEN